MFNDSAVKSMNSMFVHFGVQAKLTFSNNATVDTLVIHRRPDVVDGVIGTRVHTETDVFEIRMRDIPVNTQLVSIQMGDDIYHPQGEHVKDQHQLILQVDAYAVESSN